MNLNTVLFDLDSTLCQSRGSRDATVAEAFERANVEPYCTAADLSTVTNGSLEVDADSELEYYTLCFEAAAEQAGVTPEDALAVAHAYDAIGGQSDVELLSGTKEVLHHLEGTYALGLVTNGLKEIQEKKVDTLGIRDSFDTLVFATPDEGYKPNSYPFEQALSALDTTPDSTIHVGDSLHADVAGANAMGMTSVWIPQGDADSVDSIEPDHTLDSLADLPPLLNEN